jgi:SAM-dependent methyltransferase
MTSLLDITRAYQLFTYLIGGYDLRRVWVAKHVRPWRGARVLDIGCGPADMLEMLPGIDYTGFDPSEAYIQHARKRWGARGSFLHKDLRDVSDGDFLDYDLVIAFGILHHLPDELVEVFFKVAYRALKKGGRLVTLDGCYREGQGSIERFLLRHDRGEFVRNEKQYLALAEKHFPTVIRSFNCSKLRIPYCTLTMECLK